LEGVLVVFAKTFMGFCKVYDFEWCAPNAILHVQDFWRRGSEKLTSDIEVGSFCRAVKWSPAVDVPLEESRFCKAQNNFDDFLTSPLDRDV